MVGVVGVALDGSAVVATSWVLVLRVRHLLGWADLRAVASGSAVSMLAVGVLAAGRESGWLIASLGLGGVAVLGLAALLRARRGDRGR